MSTNNAPLVSICCLGYNHGKFIKENIQTVWNSDYDNVEIIVMDDGSTDDSAQILKELAKQSPCNMQVILQKNTGNIGHNFNVAMQHARGKYISFISLDDVLMPDTISACCKILQADKNIAFVASSRVAGIDANGNPYTNIPPLKLDSMSNVTVDDLLELEYNEVGAFYIQGAVFRKDIIDAVGGFDEDMTGDDIVLRTKIFRYMQKHSALSFVILPRPLCMYRQHDSNVHLNSARQIKIITEYMQRYWPDRPNPQILIDWGLYTLRHLPKEKWYEFFSMNARALSLLGAPQVIDFLKVMDVQQYIWLKVPFVLNIFKTKNIITGERNVYVKFCGLKFKVYHKIKH